MKKTTTRKAVFCPLPVSLLFLSLSFLSFSFPLSVPIAQAQTDPENAMPPPAFTLNATQIAKAKIGIRSLGDIATDAHRGGGGEGDALSLPGTVTLPLDAQEVVSVPLAGTVQAILAPPSQPVRAGQPLLRLFSPQFLQWQREFVQAAVQERLAEEKLRRDTALFADGIIAESRLQDARGNATQSRALADESAQMLRLAGMSEAALRSLRNSQKISAALEVTARADGVVIEYSVVPGQQVEAGGALARLARGDKLWVELSASRQQAAQINIGNRIRFTTCPDEAKVISVSPQLTTGNQTVLVRGALSKPSSCLRANQYVETRLYAGQEVPGSRAVPSTSLVRHMGRHWIFVRTEKGFAALPVQVTASADGYTHVIPEALSKTGAAPVLKPETAIAVSGTAALKGAWLGIGMEGMEEETPAEPAPPAQNAQGGMQGGNK